MNPNPLAPTFMEGLVSFGLPLAVLCVVIYSVLRFAVWSPRNGPSLDHVRNHAYWTGVIAWALSSLGSAGRAGLYNFAQPNAHNSPWSVTPWPSLLGPVLAIIAVHAIGQATWPAPKSAKRVAALEFRRVRDYVPTALGWTTLAIFLATAAVIPFVARAGGFEAVNAPVPGAVGAWTTGRIDGGPLALALSLTLAALGTGTLLVMRLVASRRSLANLSAEQNKTLRIIGMNRLLRVSATVASGLAAVAGNYLIQPVPGSDIDSFVNWLGLVNMAVLVTMFFWKPPALEPAPNDPDYRGIFGLSRTAESGLGNVLAASRFSGTTYVLLAPTAVIGALLGYALRFWLGSMGPFLTPFVLMPLAYLWLEVVMRRNYTTAATPRTPLRHAILWPLYAAFAISAVGLLLAVLHARHVSITGGRNTWDGLDTPAAMYLIPCAMALAILLSGAAALRFVLARPPLTDAPRVLDEALRRRSLFRIARTITGGWYATLGMVLIMMPLAPLPSAPSFEMRTWGTLCLVVGVLLAIYPIRKLTPADFGLDAAELAPHGASPGQR
ncbi:MULTISPECIES: hypothetical protein [Arthrobacter]|uniref:hypothetical protein n=1 Tax=Arthrobacter TaxID=1663 RepID=UPI0033963673